MAKFIVRSVVTMQRWPRLGFYNDNRGKGERNFKGSKGNAGTWSRFNINEFKSYFDSKASLLDQ